MRNDVSFYSDGALVKGFLYIPDGMEEKERRPAIVLCHGFAGVKELLLPAYAEAFCNSGFVVLAFDYRGFGESEGVAGKLVPREQIVDIRCAVTYMQSLSQVDPERVGLWGTSFGGANAIVTASLDKRVKCLAVQLTFGNGERVITGPLGDTEKEKMLGMIAKMQTRAVTQNKVMMVPIHKVLTDEQSIEFYQRYKDDYPALNIKLPFLTVKETLEHKPENALPNVDVPIFIVAAENDKVNPKEESDFLYEKAAAPKELYVVENATHYELYEGEKFREVAHKQIEWFKRYL
ncbi:MAG: alpha/beta fold hydrolase [bacterium]|nr:alpha/beta fold hydrolase [bacterium]